MSEAALLYFLIGLRDVEHFERTVTAITVRLVGNKENAK